MPPKLSFCITCLNRFEQLRETLPKNLNRAAPYAAKIEFVVVNFIRPVPERRDQGKAIHRWVLQEFAKPIASGLLRYFVSFDLQYWHASIAKNISHDQALGDFLINTDCDNFLTRAEIEFLLSMRRSTSVYHGWSGQYRDGTFGNIGMPTRVFQALGGYDESLLPAGGEDRDILVRAQKHFELPVRRYAKRKALLNSKGTGLRHANTTIEWVIMEKLNRKVSEEKIKAGLHIRKRSKRHRGLVAFSRDDS